MKLATLDAVPTENSIVNGGIRRVMKLSAAKKKARKKIGSKVGKRKKMVGGGGGAFASVSCARIFYSIFCFF